MPRLVPVARVLPHRVVSRRLDRGHLPLSLRLRPQQLLARIHPLTSRVRHAFPQMRLSRCSGHAAPVRCVIICHLVRELRVRAMRVPLALGSGSGTALLIIMVMVLDFVWSLQEIHDEGSSSGLMQAEGERQPEAQAASALA